MCVCVCVQVGQGESICIMCEEYVCTYVYFLTMKGTLSGKLVKVEAIMPDRERERQHERESTCYVSCMKYKGKR